MNHLSIKTMKLLEDIEGILASSSKLYEFKEEVKALKDRVNNPLRVAVVGLIKAGKSTLMNALMGEKLLFTGQTETTYKVTWFKYGPKPRLIIYLKNHQQIEEEMDKLEFWTVRSKKDENPRIDDVVYIEYYYPSEMLKEMELIDTPGLGSTHQIDEQNAMDFLALNVDELNRVTAQEAAKADAIIYAFTKGMHEKDEGILSAFQGEIVSFTSPINAIGVLTKADIYWSSGYENPLEAGRKITDNLFTHPSIRRLLYAVLPIMGILGENRNKIGEREQEIFRKLASMNQEKFGQLIKSAKKFVTKEAEDIPVSPQDRCYILSLFAQYGVSLLTTLYREGKVKEDISHYLNETSGIYAITTLIKQHFRNRANLIKMKFILTRIRSKCEELKKKYPLNDVAIRRVIDEILEECEKVEINEHSFEELKVLQYYYNGELNLREEEMQGLLRLTGEYGTNCEAKLGVQEGTTVAELAEIAKKHMVIWNERASKAWLHTSNHYEEVCRVLTRSCEILYYHLSYLSGNKF